MHKIPMKPGWNGLLTAALFGAACAYGNAQAATVDFSFSDIAAFNPPTTTMAGTSPWLNVQITDVSTDTVSVTVTGNLDNSYSPPQTLTGLWLNIPSVTSGLTDLTLSGGSGTGVAPVDFSSGSTFSTTQSALPSGATAAEVGSYNIYLKFPNSDSSASFQGTDTETFDLTGVGAGTLTASAFYALSLPKASGDPSYYALAAITNANGSGSGGIAYIAPVPLSSAWILMVSGIGLLGMLLGKKQTGCRSFCNAQAA